MLQSHARKYEIAINSLEFSSSYLTVSAREVTEAPTDGVIVFGLWMEGASWSMASGGLTDSSPGILYSVSDQSDRCTRQYDTTPLTSYDVPPTNSHPLRPAPLTVCLLLRWCPPPGGACHPSAASRARRPCQRCWCG